MATAQPCAIPLHNPILPLTPDQADRYKRNWLTYGQAGQERLATARVLVVGAGGLGSPVLMYLAGAGVGTIGIADHDAVELHNLSRQLLHRERSEGINKARSAQATLAELNSEISLAIYGRITREFLQTEGGQWDLIVECSDNFSTKYLVADWCQASGVPLVWGSVVATSFHVASFWSRPPQGIAPTSLRDVFPQEPAQGETPSSTDVGVISTIVGQAGTAMATEAIKLITGTGTPLLGAMLVGEPYENRYTCVPYNKHASALSASAQG